MYVQLGQLAIMLALSAATQARPHDMSPPSVQECDRILTGPGQILEIETKVLNGRRLRVWKNIPPTFRDFIIDACGKYRDRIFLNAPSDRSGGRESITYADTLERSLTLAAWLREQGLGIGSKVAIGGGNDAGWLTSWMATHLMGGIAVMLNAWLPLDALVHCIKTVKPDIILVDIDRAEALDAVHPKLSKSGIGPMLCWHDLAFASGPLKNVRSVSEVVRPSNAAMKSVTRGEGLASLGPESDAVIFFSSGTSGLPKAVLSTQRMALSSVLSAQVGPQRAALRAGLPPPPQPTTGDPQRVSLISVPLFHVTGCLAWLFRALYSGQKIVTMRQWSAKEAGKLIKEHGANVIGGVPTVVATLLQDGIAPKDWMPDYIVYGGAPPSKALAAEMKARWPKAYAGQGYGMTELNAYAIATGGADYVAKPDSVGVPVPICDIKIVDPSTRKSLPVGETGLLLVRGPQVMKEYYGNPRATRETIDADGWLDTGDVACVDKEGFVYIRDRIKDIIIRGGENITSAEVENALHALPEVAEAVAIGLPHPRLGEVVGAIVALRQGQHASGEELRKAVDPQLGRRARPEFIMVWDGVLPRNVNGKLVKKDLKPVLIEAYEKRKSKRTPYSDVRSKL